MSPVFNMIVRLLFGLALGHQFFCHAWREDRCFSEMKLKYRCFNLRPPFNNSFFKYPQSPTKQNIHFKLYTNSNPTIAQILGAQDVDSITNSNFDPTGKVTFFTHGFLDSSDNDLYKPMVEQLLTKVPNVVMVDYKKGARTGYFQATANARVVGAQLATLIETMEQLGLDLGDVYLIGISLGAQVSGYAGEKFQTKKIGRITGLDPAGPNFERKDDVVKLEKTDAAFVDIIHTDIKPFSSGGLGTSEVIGDVDFYPNGGKDMPGCEGIFGCSHGLSFFYFLASINNNDFLSYPCASLDDYKKGLCTTCGNGCNHMGYGATPSPEGIFVFDTGDKYPY